LGRALAEQLASRGAEVVVADRQIDLANFVVGELKAAGSKATAVEVDVRDYEQVRRLIEGTYERAGRLDYVFNNAGIAIGGFTHRMSIQDWHDMIDVNLKGVIHGMHVAYKLMIGQGFGHIVNTGSVTGLMPGPPAYAATKSGIVNSSISLRLEAEERNVRISVICPGAIRSPMIDGGGKYGKNYDVPEDVMEEYWKQYRPSAPETLARHALDEVAKNKAIILTPKYWNMFWWMYRLSPDFVFRVGKKRFAEMRAKLLERGIDI
jgi:NAD(P)-dependent dehydrogenase (short-subunit alcohol dehydrogenase family)